jgi:hypothetical protein
MHHKNKSVASITYDVHKFWHTCMCSTYSISAIKLTSFKYLNFQQSLSKYHINQMIRMHVSMCVYIHICVRADMSACCMCVHMTCTMIDSFHAFATILSVLQATQHQMIG